MSIYIIATAFATFIKYLAGGQKPDIVVVVGPLAHSSDPSVLLILSLQLKFQHGISLSLLKGHARASGKSSTVVAHSSITSKREIFDHHFRILISKEE